ncbi:hypothetical protein N657DRAFT_584118, partial [Parathielavia appendiculata]
LCDSFLPREFATYINYTRGLAFDDKPDYLYLHRLFYRRFRAEGFKKYFLCICKTKGANDSQLITGYDWPVRCGVPRIMLC